MKMHTNGYPPSCRAELMFDLAGTNLDPLNPTELGNSGWDVVILICRGDFLRQDKSK